MQTQNQEEISRADLEAALEAIREDQKAWLRAKHRAERRELQAGAKDTRLLLAIWIGYYLEQGLAMRRAARASSSSSQRRRDSSFPCRKRLAVRGYAPDTPGVKH